MSRLPRWGVGKRLSRSKPLPLPLSLGVLRLKVTAPSRASVWKRFPPHDPDPEVCLDLVPGPVLPLSASGVAAARPQLDMHLPRAVREQRGPRTSRVAGADAAEPLSLASWDREHWNASAFLPERHRSPRGGRDAHGPARASLTGVQLLGGRAELRIFRDSVSNIWAFGRSA